MESQAKKKGAVSVATLLFLTFDRLTDYFARFAGITVDTPEAASGIWSLFGGSDGVSWAVRAALFAVALAAIWTWPWPSAEARAKAGLTSLLGDPGVHPTRFRITALVGALAMALSTVQATNASGLGVIGWAFVAALGAVAVVVPSVVSTSRVEQQKEASVDEPRQTPSPQQDRSPGLEDFATVKRPIATREELSQKRIANRTFHIYDLPRDEKDDVWIDGVQLESCTIVGPAIIGLADLSLLHKCTFGVSPDGLDSIFWGQKVNIECLGVIAMRDVLLTNCRFVSIGVAMPEENREGFRRLIKPAIRPHGADVEESAGEI